MSFLIRDSVKEAIIICHELNCTRKQQEPLGKFLMGSQSGKRMQSMLFKICKCLKKKTRQNA
jgi:hypothetical protein